MLGRALARGRAESQSLRLIQNLGLLTWLTALSFTLLLKLSLSLSLTHTHTHTHTHKDPHKWVMLLSCWPPCLSTKRSYATIPPKWRAALFTHQDHGKDVLFPLGEGFKDLWILAFERVLTSKMFKCTFIDSRERERGGKRVRKRNINVRETSISCLQSGHVPCLGIEPLTLWFTGWCSNQMGHTGQGSIWRDFRYEWTSVEYTESIIFLNSALYFGYYILNSRLFWL